MMKPGVAGGATVQDADSLKTAEEVAAYREASRKNPKSMHYLKLVRELLERKLPSVRYVAPLFADAVEEQSEITGRPSHTRDPAGAAGVAATLHSTHGAASTCANSSTSNQQELHEAGAAPRAFLPRHPESGAAVISEEHRLFPLEEQKEHRQYLHRQDLQQRSADNDLYNMVVGATGFVAGGQSQFSTLAQTLARCLEEPTGPGGAEPACAGGMGFWQAAEKQTRSDDQLAGDDDSGPSPEKAPVDEEKNTNPLVVLRTRKNDR
ncbi:unnamed protein product [Amoebophrya sp. A120]|nr:unnamed protein product [Amoebophrya sp. A120]|eukprot:GSA120T00021772001.1